MTQTTLSVDETAEIITALRARFPAIYAPKKEDICYATSNRQWAVKEMLGEIDLLLVIGSRNSSNSNRLVEVARAGGVASHLIDDETEIDEAWLDGVEIVGVTSGASAPEKLVERVCDWFRARGVTEIEPYRLVDEDVEFRLPVELRRELALADAQRLGLACSSRRSPTSTRDGERLGGEAVARSAHQLRVGQPEPDAVGDARGPTPCAGRSPRGCGRTDGPRAAARRRARCRARR